MSLFEVDPNAHAATFKHQGGPLGIGERDKSPASAFNRRIGADRNHSSSAGSSTSSKNDSKSRLFQNSHGSMMSMTKIPTNLGATPEERHDRIYPLFHDYANSSGFCTGDDVLDILAELGFDNVTEAAIRVYLQSWEEVDFDLLSVVVEQLLMGDRREGQVVNSKGKVKDKVVVLPLHHYLLLKIGLGPKVLGIKEESNVEYAIQAIDFTLNARQMLLAYSSGVVLATAFFIILAVALLWSSQSSTRDETKLLNMNRVVQNTANKHLLESILRANKELQDEVGVLSDELQQVFSRSQDTSKRQLAQLSQGMIQGSHHGVSLKRKALEAEFKFKHKVFLRNALLAWNRWGNTSRLYLASPVVSASDAKTSYSCERSTVFGYSSVLIFNVTHSSLPPSVYSGLLLPLNSTNDNIVSNATNTTTNSNSSTTTSSVDHEDNGVLCLESNYVVDLEHVAEQYLREAAAGALHYHADPAKSEDEAEASILSSEVGLIKIPTTTTTGTSASSSTSISFEEASWLFIPPTVVKSQTSEPTSNCAGAVTQYNSQYNSSSSSSSGYLVTCSSLIDSARRLVSAYQAQLQATETSIEQASAPFFAHNDNTTGIAHDAILQFLVEEQINPADPVVLDSSPLDFITDSVGLRPDQVLFRADSQLVSLASVSRDQIAKSSTILGAASSSSSSSSAATGSLYMLVVMDRLQAKVDSFREEIVQTVNWLNFQFVRTTELVVGTPLPTGGFRPQANTFRFQDGCFGQCERRTASTVNVLATLQNKGDAFSVTPDYRPEPVLGASTYVGQGLDLAFLIEKDVQEVNTQTLASLVALLERSNERSSGSQEVQLVRWEGLPPVRLFDPNRDCSGVAADCHILSDFGVVFRSDCAYCRRDPSSRPTREDGSVVPPDVSGTVTRDTLEYLSTPKQLAGQEVKLLAQGCHLASGDADSDSNSGGKTKNMNKCSDPVSLAALRVPEERLPFLERNSETNENNNVETTDVVGGRIVESTPLHPPVLFTELDYAETKALATASHLTNYSAAVIVKVDLDEVKSSYFVALRLAIVLSCIILAISFLTFTIVTRYSVARVEEDWSGYRAQIEKEKAEYSLVVRDVLPPFVAAQALKGKVLTADPHNAAIGVCELCGSAEIIDTFPPEEIRRYFTYLFFFFDSVIVYYDLYRVQRIGDTYLIVARVDVTSTSGGGNQRNDSRGGGGGKGSSGSSGADGDGNASGDRGEKGSSGGASVGARKNALFRMIECMLTIARLSDNNKYAHYPHRVALMQNTFGPQAGVTLPNATEALEEAGAIQMPTTRCAIHYGLINGILLNIGTFNRYDVVGPNVALAFRLQSMAMSDSILVTGVAKESLDRLGDEYSGNYEFSDPKKTVVRGHGLHTTYQLKSAEAPLPRHFINEFGIKLSRRRVIYGTQKGDDNDGAESMYSTATYEQD